MRKAARFLLPLVLCTVALAAEDGEIPTPEATVRKLYDEHLRDKGPIAERDKRKSELAFLFGEGMRKALAGDRWGFDPLVFGQDFDVKDLAVKEIDRDKRGNALVLVSFLNFGEPTRLLVALKHTDHGYRIENIVDPVTGVNVVRDLSEDDGE